MIGNRLSWEQRSLDLLCPVLAHRDRSPMAHWRWWGGVASFLLTSRDVVPQIAMGQKRNEMSTHGLGSGRLPSEMGPVKGNKHDQQSLRAGICSEMLSLSFFLSPEM